MKVDPNEFLVFTKCYTSYISVVKKSQLSYSTIPPGFQIFNLDELSVNEWKMIIDKNNDKTSFSFIKLYYEDIIKFIPEEYKFMLM